MDSLNVVAVIPARSGSKGILDKNLQRIGSHSLLEWTIGASLQTKSIARTIVSTDSTSYAQLAREFGAEAPFLRPAKYSEDNSGDLDFVLHLLDFLGQDGESAVPDMLVHLRPTTPLRKPDVIDKAITYASTKTPRCTAVRSVHEMSESAYKSFEMQSDRKLMSVFSRKQDIEASNANRQSFPKTYVGNGYVDILFPKLILESKKLHGDHVYAFETEPVVEVDSIEDLELIRTLESLKPFYRHEIFGRSNSE